MVDVRFSAIAALASLTVAVLAGAKGVVAVAAVFSLLAVGFLLRALQGHRRGGR
jgi:hypothetical protein